MTRILDMFGGILNDALKSFLYIICSPKLSFVATTKPELLEVTMDTFRGLLTPKAKTSLHCLILVLEVEELGNMHKKCMCLWSDFDAQFQPALCKCMNLRFKVLIQSLRKAGFSHTVQSFHSFEERLNLFEDLRKSQRSSQFEEVLQNLDKLIAVELATMPSSLRNSKRIQPSSRQLRAGKR